MRHPSYVETECINGSVLRLYGFVKKWHECEPHALFQLDKDCDIDRICNDSLFVGNCKYFLRLSKHESLGIGQVLIAIQNYIKYHKTDNQF